MQTQPIDDVIYDDANAAPNYAHLTQIQIAGDEARAEFESDPSGCIEELILGNEAYTTQIQRINAECVDRVECKKRLKLLKAEHLAACWGEMVSDLMADAPNVQTLIQHRTYYLDQFIAYRIKGAGL